MKLLDKKMYNLLQNDRLDFLLYPFVIAATKLEEWQSGINIEDIKSVNEVSKRIEGNSYGETLTNILEWVDYNINYWHERCILGSTLFLIMLTVGLVGVLLTFNPTYSPTLITYIIVIIYILSGITLYYAFFRLCLIHLCLGISLFVWKMWEYDMLAISIMVLMIPGTLIIYLLISYCKITKNLQDTYELTKYAISQKIPVYKIYKYNRGICRDYAKLIQALLLNYPYFRDCTYIISKPKHVAVAVRIDGNYYILDQKLPLYTIEGWMQRWNVKPEDVSLHKVEIINQKVKLKFIKDWDNNIKKENAEKDIDLDKLTEDLCNELSIVKEHAINDNLIIDEQKLGSYQSFVSNYDKITHLSYVRLLKRIIENQYCNNTKRIKNISLEKKNENIYLKIYLSKPKINNKPCIFLME